MTHIMDHRHAARILQTLWNHNDDTDFRSDLNRLVAPMPQEAYEALLARISEKLQDTEEHSRKLNEDFFKSIEADETITMRELAGKLAARTYDDEMIDPAKAALTFLRDEGPVQARGPFSVVKDADAESMELVNNVNTGIAP